MIIADRIARLGWIATAAAALATTATLGCASSMGRTSEPVSTTSTTSGDVYTPGSVELYAARREPVAPGACPRGLAQDLEFKPMSAEPAPSEAADLDQWAQCLSRPEMQHATVVLVGGDEANGPVGLFAQRAQSIRNALVMRGVDAGRVIIGATNASREGGPFASTRGVRVEVTTAETVRAFVPRETGMRQSIR